MSLCTSYSSSYPWSTGFYGTIIPQGVCIIKQFLFEQTHLVEKRKTSGEGSFILYIQLTLLFRRFCHRFH